MFVLSNVFTYYIFTNGILCIETNQCGVVGETSICLSLYILEATKKECVTIKYIINSRVSKRMCVSVINGPFL